MGLQIEKKSQNKLLPCSNTALKSVEVDTKSKNNCRKQIIFREVLYINKSKKTKK